MARKLRSAGLPYKRIASRLNVSPSSAYAWTKDVELTEEQKAVNLRGPTGPQNPEHIRRRAEAWAGCMLYWAEGAKARNTAKLSNSDPNMVRFFRRFLTESLHVEIAKISMTLNVYTTNGRSIGEIERYWLDLLHLPASATRKHTLNHMPTSSSGRAKNKLPYGVCSLRVCSTRVVQHIYGAIQEYAGFDEPRWLDGPGH
jgi:hypothetical protein